MSGGELRWASGVGHDYSSPEYAQKTLTWDSCGQGEGGTWRVGVGGKKKKETKKEKIDNLVIFQTGVIELSENDSLCEILVLNSKTRLLQLKLDKALILEL